MVTASMNEGKEKALAYVFGLGNASPREWHLSEVRIASPSSYSQLVSAASYICEICLTFKNNELPAFDSTSLMQ